MVSLQLSKLLNPKETPLILFEEHKDSLEELITNLVQVNSCFKVHAKLNDIMPNVVPSQDKRKAKKKDERGFNPNDLIIDESSSDEEEEDISSDTDSVESLQSLNTSDDGEGSQNPFRPHYLKDLVDFLFTPDQDKDQVFKIEAALKHAVDVIDRADFRMIQFHGVHLCTALLTCTETQIENYFSYRMNAMVALLTKSCQSVISLQFDKQDQRSIDFEDETILMYLTNKLWSNQVTQAQRLDILSVLVKSALHLSNYTGIVGEEQVLSKQEDQKETTKTDNDYIPQYPSNTRRWGSNLKKKAKVERPTANNFLIHANRFYYMLLRTKSQVAENIHVMFGEDGLLLSKLIHTLGVFLYCCGSNPTPIVGQRLGKDTIEFLWTMVVHSKEVRTSNALRSSILNTLNTAVNCCTTSIILEELLIDIQKLGDWLVDTHENDASQECRELARICLSSLSTKMK